jgi:hypothetical protein
MRPPYPAKIVGVVPIAIGAEIFGAPNVFVVVFDVVFKALSQKLLTFANPIVNHIARERDRELPVAHVLAGDDELSRATVAQDKPGRVGINSGAAAIAHGQPDASVIGYVDPV